MLCTRVFLLEWSKPLTCLLLLLHAVSTFVRSCSSGLHVTFLMKLSCPLATWFWIIGISKKLLWIISLVILSSFTYVIVTPSILLMLQCRKTFSLFISEMRRAQISHPHSRRFMAMERNIRFLLRRSTDVSFQKWFNAPIDEEEETSILSTS